MTYFTSRPAAEQETIRAAYEFECEAMAADLEAMSEPNPYAATILGWADGAEVWEGINEALEMAAGR